MSPLGTPRCPCSNVGLDLGRMDITGHNGDRDGKEEMGNVTAEDRTLEDNSATGGRA